MISPGKTTDRTYDLTKATDRALRHVDVSCDTGCSPSTVAAALKTGRVDETSRLAVQMFLAEGEEHVIVDVVTQNVSTFETLAALARDLLPADHPTRAFLSGPPQ